MYDDDFLDRLLNSSGDDLDRLIQHDRDMRKQRHHYEGIEVDMSDIERILNSNVTTPSLHENSIVSVSYNYTPTESLSEDYFSTIYAQLTEDYSIDRVSAIELHSKRERTFGRVAKCALVVLLVIGIVWLIRTF